jgi:ComF family protein
LVFRFVLRRLSRFFGADVFCFFDKKSYFCPAFIHTLHLHLLSRKPHSSTAKAIIMFRTALEWIDDLIGLLYPHLCPACEENALPRESLICLQCHCELPYTDQHLEVDNAFTERFWGRVPLETGAAMLHFVKSGRVQALIHQLKYGGNQEVGIRLGMMFGEKLRTAPLFESVDLIIPIPLHPRRQRQRGYNQSACIAAGLSQGMSVTYGEQYLRRVAYTSTQTKKSRMGRFDNVSTAFQVRKAEQLEGKHVLLVDDVLTTGATLEAAALQLLEVPGLKLSMATLAIAGQ